MHPALLLVSLLLAAPPGGAVCPHQDSSLTAWQDGASWPGGVPGDGDDVTIDKPILLSGATAQLNTVTITSGGKLVFDPNSDSSELFANLVHIEDSGEFWIGSEDCPFTGEAIVHLTGKRDEASGAPSDQKAVVNRGGKLEVHGENKSSWTKLTATVAKTSRAEIKGRAKYNEEVEESGIQMRELNADGTLSKNWGLADFNKMNSLADKSSGTGRVVVMAAKTELRLDARFVEAFEKLCYGSTGAESGLRSRSDRDVVAFVAICSLDSPQLSVEQVGESRFSRSQTDRLVKTIGNVDFVAQSVLPTSDYGWSFTDIMSYASGETPELEVVLTLKDEVISWRKNDEIVLTSTDFNWNQAEVFKLLDCPTCTSQQVKIAGPVRYTHWGEETLGVDMRGEVGMMTRNVRFHGLMEDTCYGSNKCDVYDFDTFGGHIKIEAGFQTARIENAEIFHMGQALLGAYPVHFHMVLDTSAKDAYVRNNAIHHTFSRCVTVHGTHNLTVQDNVCADHLGHGIFLEDGGEQDNRLIGNLVFGTKKGTLIISDDEKFASFWVANPDNEIIDNVAAGGGSAGIYILCTKMPIDLSANVDMGLVEGQAERTNIKAFSGNVVHSYPRYGLILDDLIEPDGSLTTMEYSPLVDPTDPKSARTLIKLGKFTGYKNTVSAWVGSAYLIANGWQIAESSVASALMTTHSENRDKDLMNILANARIVGDTDNKGEPESVELLNGTIVQLDRSAPRSDFEDVQPYLLPQTGVSFYRGPFHLRNTSFAGFKNNAVRPAAAIGDNNNGYNNYLNYLTSPINSARGVTFDDGDVSRFYAGGPGDAGFNEKDGSRHSVILDVDGSVTTYPGASMMRPIPVLWNARCVLVPDWGVGAALCPDRFTRVSLVGVAASYGTLLTRGDLGSDVTEVAWVEFLPISYPLNSREEYIVHFNESVPTEINLRAFGVSKAVSQVFGVCIGANQAVTVQPSYYQKVATLAEVRADTTSRKYFYDEKVGVVMFRLSNPYERLPSTLSNCPGNAAVDPALHSFGNGECEADTVITIPAEHADGDCRQRAYVDSSDYTTTAVSSAGKLIAPVFT